MGMVLLVLLLGSALVAAVLISVTAYRNGLQARERRRREEILRSFDGRPDVIIPASGAGMSIAETIRVARRHGYEMWGWEPVRRSPPRLRFRLQPPPQEMPTAAAAPHAQSQTSGIPGVVPQASSRDLQEIQRDVYRVTGRATVVRLADFCVIFGVLVMIKAVSDYRVGNSYVLEAAIAIALILGSVVGGVVGRVAMRRQNERFNKEGGAR